MVKTKSIPKTIVNTTTDAIYDKKNSAASVPAIIPIAATNKMLNIIAIISKQLVFLHFFFG